jgi:hypothetical protein
MDPAATRNRSAPIRNTDPGIGPTESRNALQTAKRDADPTTRPVGNEFLRWVCCWREAIRRTVSPALIEVEHVVAYPLDVDGSEDVGDSIDSVREDDVIRAEEKQEIRICGRDAGR